MFRVGLACHFLLLQQGGNYTPHYSCSTSTRQGHQLTSLRPGTWHLLTPLDVSSSRSRHGLWFGGWIWLISHNFLLVSKLNFLNFQFYIRSSHAVFSDLIRHAYMFISCLILFHFLSIHFSFNLNCPQDQYSW